MRKYLFCFWIISLLIVPFTFSFTPLNTKFCRQQSSTLKMTTATNDDSAIRQLLATYQESLNKSDADLAASCYTSDGIFMPTTLPTAAGTQALKDSYTTIFGNIQLDVKFIIEELVVTSDTYAYALTSSKGHVTIKATGDRLEEANREIFIFTKTADDWKIARYMFNKSS